MARIIFKDNKDRKLFFSTLRKKFNTYKKFRNKHNINKTTLDWYISGKYSMDKDLFMKILSYFENGKATYFSSRISELSDNWGCIKGGRRAYVLYPDNFKKGRLIGAKSLKKGKYKFDHNICLNEGICEFIGCLIGDGFINNYPYSSYFIQFAGDTRYDLEYYKNVIIPIIRRNFGNPYVKIKSKENKLRITIHSKSLFLFLTKRFKIPTGKKVYKITMPQEIINSNQKNICATLRGIFDTDGCIMFDRRKIYKIPYPRISLQIASEKLGKQVRDLLQKLDFKVYFYKNKRNLMCVEVYGKQQYNRWMSLIGFSNPKHLNRISRSSSAG